MVNIGSQITVKQSDKKAYEDFCSASLETWTLGALKGMINKSIKAIIKDYLKLYKSKNASIPTDIAVLIPALIVMEEFKFFNRESPEKMKSESQELSNISVKSQGFDIEDYEDAALKAYYKNPEETLNDFVENKMALRENAFVKKYTDKCIQENLYPTLPSKSEDFINLITIEGWYKNAATKEME